MAVHLIHQQCQFLGPSFSMKLCEQPAIVVSFQLMRTLCRNQRIFQYVIQNNNDDFVLRQYGDLELDYLSLRSLD